jgi:L-threonylcarbamoyladenylate synthase
VRRIPIDSLLSSPEEVFRLRELLGNGGVLALPTETFYGFAAEPKSEAGVRRIFSLKGRAEGKPLPVLFGKRTQLDWLGIEAEPATLEHYFQIWPAPLTVLFAIREPVAASRGTKKLGVRLPASKKLRTLLAVLGPVTGTSVNRAGRPAFEDPDIVEEVFKRELEVLIDGGKTPGGKPTTVIDATQDPPAVLRAGAFPWPG